MRASWATLLGLLAGNLGGVLSQSPGDPPAWQTGVLTDDGSCGPNSLEDYVCTPTWGACCGADGRCGFKDACGDGWATATAISLGLASLPPTALVAIPTCTTAPTQALVPAAHLPTGAETRLDTAVPAANLFSASAPSPTSVLTARVALQTVTRLVLGPALATAARQEAGAATPLITARPVASLALALVMLGQEIFPPMVNAVPMARPALVLALETAARQEDGVAVPVITVVQVVSLVLAHAPAGAVPSRLTGSVGQGMAKLVRALALETAALRMASVVARRITVALVVRAGSGPAAVEVVPSRPMVHAAM
ncbi:uncharacterized protein QC763_0083450 [Podospora pseudopauciseta]|uniref:Uncharacterized protein n=1 Tax=Podospora pseudopauciseta TaxID=2093780 RepID=A0ABR0H8L3_9PEZI|nr:hypothetical protein QC763_0083450 [Podospora pseudopauciseta]